MSEGKGFRFGDRTKIDFFAPAASSFPLHIGCWPAAGAKNCDFGPFSTLKTLTIAYFPGAPSARTYVGFPLGIE